MTTPTPIGDLTPTELKSAIFDTETNLYYTLMDEKAGHACMIPSWQVRRDLAALMAVQRAFVVVAKTDGATVSELAEPEMCRQPLIGDVLDVDGQRVAITSLAPLTESDHPQHDAGVALKEWREFSHHDMAEFEYDNELDGLSFGASPYL